MSALERSTTKSLLNQSTKSLRQLCQDFHIDTSGFVNFLTNGVLDASLSVTYTEDASPGSRVECYGQLADPRSRVVVASAPDGKGTRQYALAFGFVVDWGLGNIPLINQVAAAKNYYLANVGLGGTSGPLAKTDLDTINKTLSTITDVSDLPQFPASGLVSGTDGLDGPGSFVFICLSTGSSGELTVVGQSVSGTRDTPTSRAIDKDIGPLHLQSIGVAWESTSKTIWVILEADLKVGPLEAEVTGLKIGVPIKWPPNWSLINVDLNGLGMGVDFTRYPFHVGGAVLYQNNAQYDLFLTGAFILQTLTLNFDAYGAYMRMKDPEFTSMFLYDKVVLGQADGVGIPPFVVFRGFCVGFGYNSTIRMPDPRHVDQFPLMISSTAPESTLDALRKVNSWISPQEGSFWGTLGAQATILEQIDADALIVINAGQDDWGAAVLGAAQVSVPAKGGAGKIDPAMYVELTLAAEYAAETGLLAFASSFTDNSYILMKAGKLTGEVLLYAWLDTSKPNGGDWVAVAGGYNPGYTPEPYYPQNLRLIGASWTVSDLLSLSWGCYAALTPSAVMAGVELHASVKIEFEWKNWIKNIKIGFRAGGDLAVHGLLQWHPFHFKLEASYHGWITVDVLFSPTFEFTIHGSIWIAPFGGTIDFNVLGWIKVSLPFGSSEPSIPNTLTWGEFATAMLPASNGRVQISAASGRSVPQSQDSDASTGAWLVSINSFTFTTYSHAPATSATLNGTALASEGSASTMDVRPMGKGAGENLTSTHAVTISRDNTPLVADEAKTWRAAVVTGHVPSALWGAPLDRGASIDPGQSPLRGDPALTAASYITGTSVSAPSSQLGQGLPSIAASVLQNPEAIPDGHLPLKSSAPGHAPTTAADAVGRIAGTLLSTSPWRSALYAALRESGYDPQTNDALTGYQERVKDGLFTAQPLLV
ncbi:DUF6603 domain-containing protein [Streptomyces violascens]|uniref:DUF6603 domain-containing protein n=1 Tax=Streptomyces violascens TaxID=67381 RepID=UPI0036AEFA41